MGGLSAQIIDNVYNLTGGKVQPDYWTFARPIEPGVDPNGDLGFTIPILELSGRGGLTYPVSFSYRSGIKPDQMPSWIGTGWFWDPGSITRDPEVLQQIYGIEGGTSQRYGVDVFDKPGIIGQMPDRYYLTIPGQTGFTFRLSNASGYESETLPNYEQGDLMPVEQNGFKIQTRMGSVTIGGISAGIQDTSKNDIQKILVTSPDGIRYLFASPTLSYVDTYKANTFGSTLQREIYVSTWRLVSIFGTSFTGDAWEVPDSTTSGPWIRFTYSSPVTYTQGGSWLEPTASYFRQTQYLSHIDSPTHRIEVQVTSRVDPLVNINEGLYSGLYKKVDEIRYKHGTTLLRRITLQTENIGNSFTPKKVVGSSTWGRLKLTGMRFYGSGGIEEPGYRFDYEANPSGKLQTNEPENQTDCRDDYGYFNRNTDCGTGFQDIANNESWAWSMNQIIHPTGSMTQIEYEADRLYSGQLIEGKTDSIHYMVTDSNYYATTSDYFNWKTYQGGPRVLQIDQYDGNEGHVYRQYSYGRGWSSGIPPNYFRRIILQSDVRSRLSANLSRDNASVFYERVTESKEDFGPHTASERVVVDHFYTTVVSGDAFFAPRIKTVYLMTALGGCSTNEPPFSGTDCKDVGLIYGDQDALWGLEYRRDTYTDNHPVRIDYLDIRLFPHGDNPILSYVFGHPGMNIDFIPFRTTANFRVRRNPEPASVDYQLPYGIVSVLHQKIYDDATNLVKRHTEYTSGIDSLFTVETTFAHEVYPAMADSNMLTQVARVDRSFTVGTTPTFTASEVATWRKPPSRSFWSPWRSMAWKTDAWASSPVAFSNWSDSNVPTGWIERSRITDYDEHGNPSRMVQGRKWVQDLTFTFNHSRIGTIRLRKDSTSTTGSLVDSVAYNAWGKDSIHTNGSGTRRYYEYDAFGRLSLISNNNNDLIESRAYFPFRTNLVGWTFSNDFVDTQQNQIVERRFDDGYQIEETVRYFDGRGANIQNHLKVPDGWWVDHADIDGFGNTFRQWKPYSKSGSTSTYVTDAAQATRTWYTSYLQTGSATLYPFVEYLYYEPTGPQLKWSIQPSVTTRPDTVKTKTTEVYINSGADKRIIQQLTDEIGLVTRQYSDGRGHVFGNARAVGVSGQEAFAGYQFDGAWNVRQHTDPMGLVSTYLHNTLGQRTQKTSPDAGTVKYKYDALGQLRYWQDARQSAVGKVGYRIYDFAGRPVTEGEATATFSSLDPDAPTTFASSTWIQVWHYDARPDSSAFPFNSVQAQFPGKLTQRVLGRLAGVATKSNGTWQVELQSYDALGNNETTSILTESQSGIATVITRTFDWLGRVTKRHDKVGSNSLYHWYEYDAAGRTHKVFSNTSDSKPSTADITTTYTPAGGVASETFFGNPAQPYKYDIRGRLVGMGDVNSSTHPFSAELSYAGNGRITLAEMRNNASPATYKRYSYAYGYDASNQLTSADYSFWVPGSGWQTSANYDIPAITYNKSGNRLLSMRMNQSGTMIDSIRYYSQSGKNRLSYYVNSAPSYQDVISYTYNENGSVSRVENADYSQYVELSYDQNERLIRSDDQTSGIVTDYRISALGWRYWSKAGTANAIYSPRDGSSPLGEFTVGFYPFTWTLRRPDGSVYGRKGYSSNNEFFWTDHLGSVRVRTSNSGSMLEAHDYYPFGLDMPGRSSAGLPMRQGFTGYWRDREGGLDLYYSGARMYSPGTGRFFGEDPLAEEFATWSPYAYTFNNPVNWRDPDGRSATDYKALMYAAGRTALGAGGVITGGVIITGATAASVKTAGQSLWLVGKGAAYMGLGGTEFGIGISDMMRAWSTPDGMTAESYGALLGIVAKGLGADETTSAVIDVAQGLATGNIGKLLADDKIITAVLQASILTTDAQKALEAYQAEHINLENEKDND